MRPRVDLSLYLVTDRPLCLGRELLDVVAAAVAGGATLVQLREKTAGGREFVELGRALRRLLDPLGVPLIVNDRVDVALACGAAGVHVGQEDIHPQDVRAMLGPDKVLGLSIKNPDQARESEGFDVDHLGVGPVFATSTKADAGAALGVAGLEDICGLVTRPVVAIGGLDEQNAPQAMAAGAAGVAVVSALCSAPSPEQAARNLLARLGSVREATRPGRDA